jgi:hypothetical protein
MSAALPYRAVIFGIALGSKLGIVVYPCLNILFKFSGGGYGSAKVEAYVFRRFW